MSPNAITERLVNATNILFYLMDLQPYALVLPMECNSSARNKRKIMQKILRNNRAAFASSGKTDSSDGKDHISTKADEQKAGMHSSHLGPSPLPTDSSTIGCSSVDNVQDANKLVRPNSLEEVVGNGSESSDNQMSAAESRHVSITEDPKPNGGVADETLAATGSDIPVEDVSSPFFTVNRIVDRLDSEDMKGCIILLASRSESNLGVLPLAGGIIEIYDEHERSIQAIWVNRSLEQRVDVQVLLNTLVLRIFAHAYQITLPDRRYSKSNKLVSIYQNMLMTFPRECVSFVEKEMLLSKHYEALGFNEPHNDNPKVPCRCHKVTPEASEMFYGISESRFNNLYTNVYEKMLLNSIGRLTPIIRLYADESFNSGERGDQITKAVRDIERSLRENNANKKQRKV
ncbi:uncharacterized protein BcabD6B2_14190 [Babesia caballi]|uniref:JAB1/MPN/MOV34 metalloenzyme domain-containing protein n=1 Tax=Babesia caballi TaxID=5871 RepID=A0AAV4LQA8_BABCB|nr:hypothetical protein BcabD6B2_14190 [Babesia caballi]